MGSKSERIAVLSYSVKNVDRLHDCYTLRHIDFAAIYQSDDSADISVHSLPCVWKLLSSSNLTVNNTMNTPKRRPPGTSQEAKN